MVIDSLFLKLRQILPKYQDVYRRCAPPPPSQWKNNLVRFWIKAALGNIGPWVMYKKSYAVIKSELSEQDLCF